MDIDQFCFYEGAYEYIESQVCKHKFAKNHVSAKSWQK